jgi:hypothetical protein
VGHVTGSRRSALPLLPVPLLVVPLLAVPLLAVPLLAGGVFTDRVVAA